MAQGQGTTALFAALNTLDGTVIGDMMPKHKRVHAHFTPTGSSWLEMVERLFRDVTENRIRRGVSRSVEELEAVIHDYLAKHNVNPKPFIWTAKNVPQALSRLRTSR